MVAEDAFHLSRQSRPEYPRESDGSALWARLESRVLRRRRICGRDVCCHPHSNCLGIRGVVARPVCHFGIPVS